MFENAKLSLVAVCASTALATVALTSSNARAELAYGVTSNGSLVRFDTATPNIISAGTFISGLQQNESVEGLDFRPANGQLYALGSTSRLYTVDATTAVATEVPPLGAFSPTLNGSNFGFDFNPVIDRIRVVSDANQNLVLNPNDGSATAATALFYGASDPNFGADPNVIHSAYTNNFAGATATQLYGIDSGLDILVTQANSFGTLGTVGPLGVDVVTIGGFDISGITGTAFLAAQPNGSSRTTLYTVNLGTGGLTAIGQIGGGATLSSFTVAVPEPTSIAALGLAGLLLVRRKR